MKKTIVLSVIAVLELNTLHGGANTALYSLKEQKTLTNNNSSKDTFRTFGIGIGRIDLGNNFHKSFSTASKIGYKYNTFNMYLFRNGNTYKHLGENHSLSIMGIGLSTRPFSNDNLTLGVGMGLGMNLMSSKIFSDFREYSDFGFAYSFELGYRIKDKWSVLLGYNKYDLNTNILKLEDTKPEIITFTIIYAFE